MHENEIAAKKAAYEAQYGQPIRGTSISVGANQALGCAEAPRYTIGFALDWLKAGRRVARRGWNGNGIFIELQVPDSNSKMSAPYIFIDTTGLHSDNRAAPRVRVPWVPSQTDMLADDWQTA